MFCFLTLFFFSYIELASKNRKKKNAAPDKAMIGMLLTKLLAGSLQGSALTGMITCVSQSPRNGDETYIRYAARLFCHVNMSLLPCKHVSFAM